MEPSKESSEQFIVQDKNLFIQIFDYLKKIRWTLYGLLISICILSYDYTSYSIIILFISSIDFSINFAPDIDEQTLDAILDLHI